MDIGSIRSGWMLGILLMVPVVLAAAPIDPVDKTSDTAPGGSNDLPGLHGSGVFIENKGQFDSTFLYVAMTTFGQIGLAEDGIYYHLLPDVEGCAPMEVPTGHVIKVSFDGGSSGTITGLDPVDTVYNYLIGDDPRAWATDVRGYQRVVYKDVWNGIDLVLSNDQGKPGYEIELSPGADPSPISFVTEGTDGSWAGDGPFSYDIDPGNPIVSGMEVLSVFNSVALNYSTFFGGNDRDEPFEMDRDPSGGIYVTGYTLSENIPTTVGAYQIDRHVNYTTEAFVFKMSSRGDNLIFCTYLGGSGNDRGTGIRVDKNNDCIVTGHTASKDFPLTDGAMDRNISANSTDLFLVRLSGDGTELMASTCIGGSDFDGNPVFDTDENDIAYIAAETFSEDFPVTSGAYQDIISSPPSGSEIVLFQFDLDDMDLIYSTYFGGTGTDRPLSIEYANGSVYVAGYSDSSDFDITLNAFQTFSRGSIDGFLFRFDFSTTPVLFSTFFSGSKITMINDLALDTDDSIYCCGETTCNDMPVSKGANDTSLRGGQDAFVFRIDPSGRSLIFSTYFGGGGEESFKAIDIDDKGCALLTGYVIDPVDHPLSFGALQTKKGGGYYEAIFVKMNGNGTNYLYSTFLGGYYDERAVDVKWDPSSDQVLVLGWTESSDFPTKHAFQPNYLGSIDVFITKMDTTLPPDQVEGLYGIAKDKAALLTWGPPKKDGGSPVLGYEVFRGEAQPPIDKLDSVTYENYFDADLKNGILYTYAVRAFNRIGAGPFSKTIEIRPDRIPSPPSWVDASNMGDHILISWNYSPSEDVDYSIDGFRVYKTVEDNDFQMVADLESWDYQDFFFEVGVHYRYYVTAYNHLGGSSPSTITDLTVESVPSQVRNLRANSGPGTVGLNWDPPETDGGSPILSYRVYRAPLRDGDFEWIKNLGGEESSYIDRVENGRDLRYRVSAMNMHGEGQLSDVVIGNPRGPPSPPLDPRILMTGDDIEISWGPPANDGGYPIRSYNIYRKVGDDAWGQVGFCDNRTLKYSEESINPGTVHKYNVTAINQLGESPPSAEVQGVPKGSPGAPRNLKGNASDGKIVLSWSSPLFDGGSRIIAYRLFRGLNESTITQMKTVPDKETSYTDENVYNGVNYHYYVKAVNDLGEGQPSNMVHIRPIGLPSAPTDVRVIGMDGQVSIMWGPPSDDGGDRVTLVRIYRSEGGGPKQYLVSVVPEIGVFVDLAVTNGITYSYRLTSVNSKGESQASKLAEAYPAGPPTAPRSVTLSQSGGSISVKWEPPISDGGSPITKYKVHRSVDGKNYVIVAHVVASVNSMDDPAPKAGSEILYWVTAENDKGESPPSEKARILMDKEASFPLWILITVLGTVIVLGASAVIYLAVVISRRPKKQSTKTPPPKESTPGLRASALSISTPIERRPELPIDNIFVKAMLPCPLSPSIADKIDMPPPPQAEQIPNYKEYMEYMMPTLGAHPVLDEGIPGSVKDGDQSL